MRIADTATSAASISQGRSGLTKTWARLRDQISSRKEIATPIWLRRATSHSNTPPSSAPPATATGAPARPARKEAVKPQISICNAGQ